MTKSDLTMKSSSDVGCHPWRIAIGIRCWKVQKVVGFDGWIQGEHLERKTMGILPSTLGWGSAWNFPIIQFWGPELSHKSSCFDMIWHDLGSTSNPYVEGFNWQLLNSKLWQFQRFWEAQRSSWRVLGQSWGGWKREVRAVKPESSTTQLHIIAEIQPTPAQVTQINPNHIEIDGLTSGRVHHLSRNNSGRHKTRQATPALGAKNAKRRANLTRSDILGGWSRWTGKLVQPSYKWTNLPRIPRIPNQG